MTRILLHGALGRMGQTVTSLADGKAVIAVGVDTRAAASAPSLVLPYPLRATLDDVTEQVDTLLDFTSPAALSALLSFAREKHIALVLATTGYTDDDLIHITAASRDIAIFRSPNFSIGTEVLADLARRAALSLPGCDVEITETHHRAKKDAPSGTALALFRAVDEAGTSHLIPRYGRAPNEPPRQTGEIGLHALRGGSAVGDHSVYFLMDGEEIVLTHRAHSRDIFARGALRAAVWIADKPAGLYSMKDMMA